MSRLLVYDKVWFGYFCSKIFYLLFAKFIFSNLTTLGDTFRYLSGPTAFKGGWLYSSTAMMDTVASSFSLLFGNILGSVPFLILSFFGVYYPLSKMQMSRRQLVIVLALLSLPSFGVWTSIASKESVGVFFMGVILAAYIDVYERRRVEKKALFITALYLCLVFKPQYMIGIFAIFLFTYLSRKFGLSSFAKLVLFTLAIGFGASVLYYFRDIIDGLSKIMPIHFSKEAGSTRENTIWVQEYDFFRNAIYGMYISFVGPTVQEALSKPTHMAAWLESMIILATLALALVKYLSVAMRTSKINVMFLCGFSLVSFWILLVHYPFGALNPGSAVRYRESFYAFLVCLFFFMYRKAMASAGAPKIGSDHYSYNDLKKRG